MKKIISILLLILLGHRLCAMERADVGILERKLSSVNLLGEPSRKRHRFTSRNSQVSNGLPGFRLRSGITYDDLNLFQAIHAGCISRVQDLLEQGENINQRANGLWGMNALEYARLFGNDEIADLLQKRGARERTVHEKELDGKFIFYNSKVVRAKERVQLMKNYKHGTIKRWSCSDLRDIEHAMDQERK